MLRKKLVALTAAAMLAFSTVPAYATENQEAITEEGIVEEKEDADGSTGSQEATTEMPHLTSFSLGYFFEDGSFDKWDDFVGFGVGDCFLADPMYGSIKEDDPLYQSVKEERAKVYAGVGIDMEDFNAVSEHVGYAIQSGDGTKRVSKAENADGPFLVLTDGKNHKGIVVGIDTVKEGDKLRLMSPGEKMTDVSVKEAYSNDGTDFFSISGDLSIIGNGMPVMFQDGSLAGIVTSVGTDNATVVADTSIAKVLDAANLSYDIKALDEKEKPDETGDKDKNEKQEVKPSPAPEASGTPTVTAVPKTTSAPGGVETSENSDSLANHLLWLVIQAENIDTSVYTEESVAALNEALDAANQIINTADGDVSDEEYTAAIDKLEAAKNGLTEKPKKISREKIFAIAGVAVGIAAILFVLLVVIPAVRNKDKYIIEDDEETDGENTDENAVKKSAKEIRAEKKAERERKKAEKKAEREAAREKKREEKDKKKKGGSYDIDEPVKKKIDSRTRREKNKAEEPAKEPAKEESKGEGRSDYEEAERDRFGGGGRFDDDDAYEDKGEEDTSVLSDEDAETSLLQAKMPDGVFLIRNEDGRKIPITKTAFIIGKASEGTDYRIRGNSTVSRRHAKIQYTDGVFTVEDLRSKNGTYLNNAKLEPDRKVTVNPGDVITFSDADYTFEMPDGE